MCAIETVTPGSPVAAAVVRTYLHEAASRWYGREATADEVERALADEPYDDLDGDTGLFLVVLEDGRAVACAGARTSGGVGELTKVFVLPSHRGRGLGSRLLRAVEGRCGERGVHVLRLDTRAELAEACAMYERAGYVRVAPFTDSPYSDRWYAKDLRG